MLAGLLTPGAAGAQGAPTIANCSLSDGEGGINASWDPLDAAIDYYVYRIETAGNPDRYGQSSEPQAFIAVEGSAQIFVGAFLTNIGYTPAVDCGTATGTPGEPEPQPTCTVQSAPGGVRASWSAIDGAVTYAWRLEIEGRPNRYNRAEGLTTVVPVPTGLRAAVFVSAVLADGSYTPAINCGIATGGPGIPDNSPTCSVESGTDGVRASWTAVADATRYVYRYERSDQPGVNRYGLVGQLETFINAPAGVSVEVFVSGQRANGSYTGAVPCGSAVVDDSDPTVPSDCTFEFFADSISTVQVRWTPAEGGQFNQIQIGDQGFFVFDNSGFFNAIYLPDLSNLPTTGSIVTESNERPPSDPVRCEQVNAPPPQTLPAPAGPCTTLPDADGSDSTIEYTKSSPDVEAFLVVVRRNDFPPGFGAFGSVSTVSPTRSQGNLNANVFYQERIDGVATAFLQCENLPIVVPN